METIQQKIKKSYKILKESMGYRNAMQCPNIEKVVISVGTARIKEEKQKNLVEDRLSKITGQKVAPRAAKKSIASFKLRQGDIVGYQITLRKKRAYSFLDTLLNIALPRTKDFRGIRKKAVDKMGNLTIGLREHTIFPQTSDEELRDVFGFAVTIVTTARGRDEAVEFLTCLGVPFSQ